MYQAYFVSDKKKIATQSFFFCASSKELDRFLLSFVEFREPCGATNFYFQGQSCGLEDSG